MHNDVNFQQLLFSEFRLMVVPDIRSVLTDSGLVEAMTLNEEFKNLGYTLTPPDIVNLAKLENRKDIINSFKNLIGDVKAPPMYPDFPKQVMTLDESTFRFHQLVHYFSTYGIECVTRSQVLRGWLPEEPNTEKTEKDIQLLNSKVFHLFMDEPIYTIEDHIYSKILSKNERMTDKEEILINKCLEKFTDPEFQHNNFGYDVKVPFKQNLLTVFYKVFRSEFTSKLKQHILKGLCQHTGDVWKCLDYTLTQENFHLRTSQKRLFVKLLESYPLVDFTSNLILSNKKGKRTNLMLQYLDYNTYSRNIEYKNAVKDFRTGRLRSWESRARYLVENKQPNALYYVCSHPGTALRMITYLLRNGYSAEDIYLAMKPHANQLSTQTLISVCTHFGEVVKATESDFTEFVESTDLCDTKKNSLECVNVYNIVRSLLKDKLISKKTPLMAKKIYIDMDEFNLTKSTLLTNNKSSEGGYIRSGIAYKIPESVNRIRYFVYWNDETRVDIDLHAGACTKTGETVHIGWCGEYVEKTTGIVFSGDITHSDAAEFIDIDLLNSEASRVTFTIDIFDGKPNFKEIRECYVGCMAVNAIGENVSLYDPKNCFFTHYLTGTYTRIYYGYVDVENRCLIFIGKENKQAYGNQFHPTDTLFTLDTYIKDLLNTQGCITVDKPEDADLILVMGKPSNEKEISLIDNNFFMD